MWEENKAVVTCNYTVSSPYNVHPFRAEQMTKPILGANGNLMNFKAGCRVIRPSWTSAFELMKEENTMHPDVYVVDNQYGNNSYENYNGSNVFLWNTPSIETLNNYDPKHPPLPEAPVLYLDYTDVLCVFNVPASSEFPWNNIGAPPVLVGSNYYFFGYDMIKIYCDKNTNDNLTIYIDDEIYSAVNYSNCYAPTEIETTSAGITIKPPEYYVNPAGQIAPRSWFDGIAPNTVDKTKIILADKVYAKARLTETQYESIVFNNETKKQIQFPYDSPKVTILYQSDFFDKNTKVIATPHYDARDCTFVSQVPCYGSFFITYEASVTGIQFYYDGGRNYLTDADIKRICEEWIISSDIPQGLLPKIQVMIRTPFQTEVVQLERELMKITTMSSQHAAGFAMSRENQALNLTLTESGRSEYQTTITAENNTSTYIVVSSIDTIVSSDGTNTLTLLLAGNPASTNTITLLTDNTLS